MTRRHFADRSVGAAIALLITAGLASTAGAMGYDSLSCDELWQRRTEILHRNGFCFTGEKEIKTYGSDKCTIKVQGDLRLSSAESKDVEMIAVAEKRKQCQ